MSTSKDSYRFQRGDKLRDRVTGFEGIVVSRGDHISGCDTYGLQPSTLKDGVPQDCKWFDDPRLELVQVGVLPMIDTREVPTGADSVPQSTRAVPR
jgi:hypothetical protein